MYLLQQEFVCSRRLGSAGDTVVKVFLDQLRGYGMGFTCSAHVVYSDRIVG